MCKIVEFLLLTIYEQFSLKHSALHMLSAHYIFVVGEILFNTVRL